MAIVLCVCKCIKTLEGHKKKNLINKSEDWAGESEDGGEHFSLNMYEYVRIT